MNGQAGWLSYITITAHTLNDDYQLKDFVLQTWALSESHTGNNIADMLTGAADQWKLSYPNQTIPIATDNATNVDAAVPIAEGFGPQIPCFAHTMNLACQRDWRSLLLHNCWVVSIAKCPFTEAPAMLQIKQMLLQLTLHKLTTDVSTHWNSSLDMLECYIKQQAVIMATLMEKEVRPNFTDMITLSEDNTHHIELVIILMRCNF